jgi:hypothetical protein
VKPSETPSGQAWLENFDEADLETASALLDSLRFVSLDELRNDLVSSLESLTADGIFEAPALLLPERNLTHLAEGKPLNKKTAVAYRDFHPGARLSPTAGSEAMIGMVLREFAVAGTNDSGSPWIPPDATLDTLRRRRCRTIVLVTDYSGSGNQVSVLADAIARHPTIKSWRSLKLIKIHVVAFAASTTALHALRTCSSIDAVHTIEVAPSFETAPWSRKLRLAILDLCLCNSRSKANALGYGQSGGLLATVRRAPNNLPAVFIQTSDWAALFPNRKVTPEVAADLSGYQADESVTALAGRVGQVRISQSKRLAYMRPASRELIRALLLVRLSAQTPEELAGALGASLPRTKSLIGTLNNLGFVDSNLRITAEGRKEIVAQKRARRYTTAALEGSDATYYPHSLK